MESIEVKGTTYRKTSVGLPNTCAGSGKELKSFGYAVNEDAALSGQIFSAEYLETLQPKAEAKESPKAETKHSSHTAKK